MASEFMKFQKQVLDFNTNHTFKSWPKALIPSAAKLDEIFHLWSLWALGPEQTIREKRTLTCRVKGLNRLKVHGIRNAGEVMIDRLRFCTACVDYVFLMYDKIRNVEVERGVEPILASGRAWHISFDLYKWLLTARIELKDVAEAFSTIKEWFLNRELESPPTLTDWRKYKGPWTCVNALLNLNWDKQKLYTVLYQCCTFFERLTLYSASKDAANDEYVEFEKNLTGHEKTWSEEPVCIELRSIAKRMLRLPSEEIIHRLFMANCMPGPGSTATCSRTLPAGKYVNPVVMPKTAYVLKKYGLFELLPLGTEISRRDYYNQVQPVPKNMKRSRIIGMEATTLQNVQHGWRAVMNHMIRTGPLGKHMLSTTIGGIAYDDQALSRIEALRGSQDGSFSTIDSSAASDWITATKVKAIYPREIAQILLSARTSVSKLRYSNGKEVDIPILKFASMGSDLCFVNLGITMALCCEAAIHRYNKRTHVHWYSYDTSLYRIVGDDITIETKFVPDLLDVMSELGMVVNRDKSFYNDEGKDFIFREACGEEAVNGLSLSPLRISRKYFMHLPFLSHEDSEEVSRRISEINLAFDHDCFMMRKWLIHLLKSTSAEVTLLRNEKVEIDLDTSDYGHCRVAKYVDVPSIWRFIPFRPFDTEGVGIKTFNRINNWHMAPLSEVLPRHSKTIQKNSVYLDDHRKYYKGFLLKYCDVNVLEGWHDAITQLARRPENESLTISQYLSTGWQADYDNYWRRTSGEFEPRQFFKKEDKWSYDPDGEYLANRSSLDRMGQDVWHLCLGPVLA